MNVTKKHAQPDANPDPMSGEPGAHPVGVSLGSAGGATVGAVVGSLAGPVGTAVGAAIGGIAGGLAGKDVAEGANPTVEDAYWREHYVTRPYVTEGTPYDDYEPAFRFGWESRGRYGELNWEKAEPTLREDWRRRAQNGKDRFDWDAASPAVKDAWNRLNVGYPSENI